VQGARTAAPGLESQNAALGPSGTPGTSGVHESFHGRSTSWVAIGIIVVGFIVGGVALVTGPTWWLFWTGAGVAGVGGILALATGVFNDWY
jgi:hypothetical protein